MQRFTVLAIAAAVAMGAFADEPARARATMDHSAFFNGAGSQHDNVPVTTGPGTRVIVRNDGHGGHGGHGGYGHHHRYWRGGGVNFWVSPVRSVWVPGHYEWRTQQVWIEPTWTTEYVPPVYQYGYEGSRQVRILVREGYYRRVQIPGHYETRQVQVWVEGYWQYY